MEENEQPQPAPQLFGGVLPDKRATQTSQKVVDFNAKQVTSALKAEATALQALHVYLFKSLKDLEVERTCLESLRRAVLSGEHDRAPPQQASQGTPAAQPSSNADPCSRFLDRLLPVDAPITDADIAAATAAPSTAHLAAAHTPASAQPRQPKPSGRGRGGTNRRNAGRGGRGKRAAPAAQAQTRTRSSRPRRRARGAGGGHTSAHGGPAAGAGEAGVRPECAEGCSTREAAAEQQLTMDDLVGTGLGHEELLAQLDAAQEILGQGLDGLLSGADIGVGGGVQEAGDVDADGEVCD